MQESIFHSYIKACKLLDLCKDEDLAAILSASNIHIYPYQLAAAQFALQSPCNKGAILCDEASLGKSYEALLVAGQKFYQGYERQILILPANLMFQWCDILQNAIPLPYHLWQNDEELPNASGLVITSYNHALKHCDLLNQELWDVAIFEEADILANPENKITITLKTLFKDSFKLLLTPTPISMSIMDIYGLIHFIDETILPEKEQFYKRYFRKAENYHELSQWISQFAFRTLKKQVANYVNFTNRIAFTYHYALGDEEQAIYNQLKTYLAVPHKQAYPKMDLYNLTLLLYHRLSSSPQALHHTINKSILRVDNPSEKSFLLKLQDLIKNCKSNSKINDLCIILKKNLTKMTKISYAKKAIIFVNNLISMDLLAEQLKKKNYQIITSHEENYAQKFRDAKEAILIANDAAAKGLNLQFCSLVINYDLPYNATDLEQRISRCHRQGQKGDVIVINFICKENFADVRILELINKRLLQFDSIFGRSDDILGQFVDNIQDIIPALRSKAKIEQDFSENLKSHQSSNKDIVTVAQEQLFTSFTKDISHNVTITPQYIEEKIEEINSLIWSVVKTWFTLEMPNYYKIDETTQIIRRTAPDRPRFFRYRYTPNYPRHFLEERGTTYRAKNNYKDYYGKPCYGMAKDFKPLSERLTLFSFLVKKILEDTKCTKQAKITVKATKEDSLPCEIAFYSLGTVYDLEDRPVYSLIGQDHSRQKLGQKICEKLLKLPVISCQTEGIYVPLTMQKYFEIRDPHNLDKLVPIEQMRHDFYTQYNNKYIKASIKNESIAHKKKRVALEREMLMLTKKNDKNQDDNNKIANQDLKNLRKIKEQKQKKADLKAKKQNLYKKMQELDRDQEKIIIEIKKKIPKKLTLSRHFILTIKACDE